MCFCFVIVTPALGTVLAVYSLGCLFQEFFIIIYYYDSLASDFLLT